MNNKRIRKELQSNHIFLWELAKIMGKSESSITRLMRQELPSDEQDRIIALIRKEGARRAR